jgi:hypothetical protein
MRDLTKSWGLGDSGDTPIYTEVGLKMTKMMVIIVQEQQPAKHMKSVRKQQGELVAQTKGLIKRLDDKNYLLNSQSGSGSYDIHLAQGGFVCSYPDYMYRSIKCKHIHAIEFSFALIEE